MAAKLRIKQSTYDEIIRENIADLEMQPEEAIDEAIKQLTSQGVDLSSVVLRPQITSDIDKPETGVVISHPVVDAVNRLRTFSDVSDERQVLDELQTIRAECGLDLAHRCLASENNGIPALVVVWRRYMERGDQTVLGAVIEAMSAAGDGNPDAFDGKSLVLMAATLSTHTSSEAICSKLLRLMQTSCKMHEGNRQALVKEGVVPSVLECLEVHPRGEGVVTGGCSLLRTLVSDDDMRVEYGKAYEHAKIIVNDNSGLKVLCRLVKENIDNIEVVGEILFTLCRLVVRNEYCQELVDIGMLKELLDLLRGNMDNQVLVKNSLHLLKAMAGNDEVKELIMKSGGGEVVVSAVCRHCTCAPICQVGCGTIAVLALRNPGHCDAIVDAGGVGAVLKSMELHALNMKTQKQACLAIRNLVARTRQHCPSFIDQGAEELIRKAQSTHPQLRDEAKAALRDLGLDVELKELWTGQKNSIHPS